MCKLSKRKNAVCETCVKMSSLFARLRLVNRSDGLLRKAEFRPIRFAVRKTIGHRIMRKIVFTNTQLEGAEMEKNDHKINF